MREMNEKILEAVKAELKQHCFVLDNMKNPLEVNGGVTLTAKVRCFEITQSVIDLDEDIFVATVSNLITEAFKEVSKISFYDIELQQAPGPSLQNRCVIVRAEWFYE